MRVFYFTESEDGGSDFYRLRQPIETAKALGLLQAYHLRNGDGLDTIFDQFLGSHVYVWPRPADESIRDLLRDIKKAGKKVVVEYDDDIFSVSPFSERYRDRGVENVTVTLPSGGTMKLWVDGVNEFDIARNRKNLSAAEACLRMADLVTVTTEHLADRYREFNPNVVVLPNCVSLNLWKRLPLIRAKPEEIRMGWFGGASHFEDWALLGDVLPEVMELEPRLKLVIMGEKFKGALKDVPPERIEHHLWGSVMAYPYRAAILDLDFGIIPLRYTPFNMCKSPIKWIELGALGVPAVTSFVPPYSGIATEENGLFVENNEPGAWKKGILQMAQDPAARVRFGGEARKYVETNFDIEKNAYLWVDAYKSLIPALAVV